MIQTTTTHITLALRGRLTTNSQGIRALSEWYYAATAHYDTTIIICCKKLDWIDANLTALWSALIYRLRKENRLEFVLDGSDLANRFSILLRNGFSLSNEVITTSYRTFIQNASFGPTEEQRFSTYIESELLQQQQIQRLPGTIQNLIEHNLTELYYNVFRHAGTSDPFFICGQYYPNRKELALSMVDLGQTFLPPIQIRTGGKISTQGQAIEWALEGNSELGEKKGGGHALKCIRKVFDEAGHCLQIATGEGFWDSTLTESFYGPHRSFQAALPGTMVNLIFKTGLSS